MTQLPLQLLASLIIILGVLWFMWRLPRKGEPLFAWAPPLSLLSAWAGLIALVISALLWLLPYPDRWIVLAFLVLDPAAIASGTLVLWIYRGHEGPEISSETISMQMLQARIGIALGLAAVAVGYMYVMLHKTPMTPVGV